MTQRAAKRIYISGPMTGLPEHNFPAFHAAAERLRKAGWEVNNPAEETSSESVLDEAGRITEGSRQSDYGHPADDFARTARM